MKAKKKSSDLSISIAIPVYNQAPTIVSTIESTLKATRGLAGTEIVVSENHSNDGTAEALSKYQGQIKIVKPPIHLNMSSNWNFAVNNCNGEWVGMLSGDDQIYPSYIHSIREAIKLYPSAVFAMGGWNNVDAKTGIKTRRRVLSLKNKTNPAAATKALLYGPKASFASYCFLKSAFEKVGGFPSEYNLIQDWMLQFELSLIGGFAKTNSVIAEYALNQERTDLELRRAPLYCEDLANFCLFTIWKATKAGIKRSLLIDACEDHMVRAEMLLSRFPELKSKGDEILRPVYELIGKERTQVKSKSSQNSLLAGLRVKIREVAESIIPQ
jgi:glycosyltransferase involved in cell wall biosynthesis